MTITKMKYFTNSHYFLNQNIQQVFVLQKKGMLNRMNRPSVSQICNRICTSLNRRYSIYQVKVPRYSIYVNNVQYHQLRLINSQLHGEDRYQRCNYWQWNSDCNKRLAFSVSLVTIFGLWHYFFDKVDCKECCHQNKNEKLSEKKKSAREILMKVKDEYGCPGVVVSVSVDGESVWSEGIGYADIENRVPCSANSVMRIASISKPITIALLAKLYEDGKVDLDKPVEEYVKEWPEKTFNSKKVSITTRQLVSHMSGIRHYDKNCGKKNTNEKSKPETAKTGTTEKDHKESKNIAEKRKGMQHVQSTETEKKIDSKTPKKSMPEFEQKEYFLKRKFPNVASSLNLFKDDELCSKPETKFLYSTHGYTLLSAVIESVSGKTFPTLLKKLLADLGLENTFLDEYETLIYNRASYYVKNKNGKLMNAPYVDVSYKWAGGGLISNVYDIVKFGNAMLCSFQQSNISDEVNDLSSKSVGYLKPETVKMMWSPISHTGWDDDSGWYGMGWGVMPEVERFSFGRKRKFCVSHTGGAVGASSVLLVMPTDGQVTSHKNEAEIDKHNNDSIVGNTIDNKNAECRYKSEKDAHCKAKHSNVESEKKQNKNESKRSSVPSGVVVGIIVNMQGVNLNPAALKIADIFSS